MAKKKNSLEKAEEYRSKRKTASELLKERKGSAKASRKWEKIRDSQAKHKNTTEVCYGDRVCYSGSAFTGKRR